jgi:hypothetical protein
LYRHPSRRTPSQAKEDLTTQYAQDFEGVKDVQNEMTEVTVATSRKKKLWAASIPL